MFIFKFFDLGERARIIQKWIEDPAEEAYVFAKNLFIKYMQSYLITSILILSGLGILGFSSLVGGPFQIAEILFYLTLFCVLVFFILISLAWRKVHSYIKKMSDEYKKRMARTVDYQEVGPFKEIE